MAYTKSEMFFFDYKWNGNESNGAGQITPGEEQKELNRMDGFEVLNYINSLAKTWGWKSDNPSSFRHLERIIRNELPADIRTHTGILEWIEANYTNI